MPLFKLFMNFMFIPVSPGQIIVKQLNNIPAAQQRIFLVVSALFPDHEYHCQTCQRHMVMPALPYPDLVLRHAQLALGFVKGVLDPITLVLHICKLPELCFTWQVGEAVFHLTALILPDQKRSLAG